MSLKSALEEAVWLADMLQSDLDEAKAKAEKWKEAQRSWNNTVMRIYREDIYRAIQNMPDGDSAITALKMLAGDP